MDSGVLNCVVVDDDELQLEIIAGLIEETPFLTLVGRYTDPVLGVQEISKLKPDIIFLDIEMPKLSGIDFAKSIGNQFQIIVVAAKADYAVEAFNLDFTDYLVKPIDDYARFLKAVTKAKENLESDHVSVSTKDDQVFIKSGRQLVQVSLGTIQYLEAYGDYVKLITDDKSHIILSTFKDISEKLPIENFSRVHRSYIVRHDKIDNIENLSIQIGEKIIPIGKSYLNDFMNKLNKL